jgi:hypothetical protein
MSHFATLSRTVATSATRRLIHPLTMLALVVGLIGFTAISSPRTASADDWCWADPIVSIEGRKVQILTGVNGAPELIRKHVQGATVIIYVPRGVDTKLLYTYSPLYPETTIFRTTDATWKEGSPIPVRVEVEFKAFKTMPAAVQVNYSGGSQTVVGTTSSDINLSFTLR